METAGAEARNWWRYLLCVVVGETILQNLCESKEEISRKLPTCSSISSSLEQGMENFRVPGWNLEAPCEYCRYFWVQIYILLVHRE